jgi:sugar phosphate isomerase/epimerase
MVVTMTDVRFGIDSFSFHRFFGENSKWEVPAEIKWRTKDFIDFARAHDLDLITLQTAYLDLSESETHEELKRWTSDKKNYLAFTWGHPNGFDGGKKIEAYKSATEWLERSAEFELEQMRIVFGNHFNFDEAPRIRMERIGDQLEVLVKRARQLGVRLSVENHADFNVPVLLEMINGIDDQYLGLCLDLGNSYRVGDEIVQLMEDIDTSRIFMIQAKEIDQMPDNVQGEPIGWWPTVNFGTGKIDIAKRVNRLIQRGFEGPIAIELSNLGAGLNEIGVAEQAISHLRANLSAR